MFSRFQALELEYRYREWNETPIIQRQMVGNLLYNSQVYRAGLNLISFMDVVYL